jgi:hypothetical protein
VLTGHETDSENAVHGAAVVLPLVPLPTHSEVVVMQKLLVYETLHALNQDFENILVNLRHLQEFPFPSREFLRHFQIVVEEARAWTNFELVEVMHQREQDDRASFGSMRQRWEKRFADPNDVLIDAKKRRQEPRQVARKRRRKGGKHV